MFSCTKQSIALLWSQTFSEKLVTKFSANKFSINAKTAALDSSNIRGHSKLSSTNFEQPTMFRNKKGLRSVNIGSKSVEFVGSDSLVTLTNNLSTR